MKKNVIETFLDLVMISSPSRREADVAEYIRKRLSDLPVHIMEDDTAKAIHGNCGNLIVQVEGMGTPILFDAHMDTVSPCEQCKPIVKDGRIYSDNTTILGADDKAGIAAMLCMLETIWEEHLPHPPITCIFSVCEEESLLGAKHLDEQVLQDICYAFVLDGEGEVGSVVDKTPYGCKGVLRIIGKEAHAGVCPQEGIHALVVASEAITNLPIGRVNEHLTCNIGRIQGGTATNVIMGEVTMHFEARSYEYQELVAFIAHVKDTFQMICDQHHALFEEDLRYGTAGYTLQGEEAILQTFAQACERAGLIYATQACGGGSNANVYRMKGLDALCIGVHMQKVHSLEEYIAIDDLQKTYELLLELCAQMCA